VSERTRWPGSWLRVVWRVPAAHEDEAAAFAGAAGSVGTVVTPAGHGVCDVEAWFEDPNAAERAAEALAGLPWGGPPRSGPEEIRDPGWLDAAMAPREPIPVGRFLVCDGRSPLGGPASGLGAVPLIVPPGRAFGTGEHATTRLCLELISRYVAAGSRVLDVGTGSGILAIGAAKLGASHVIAIDNDPRVLDVALENVRANHLGGEIVGLAGGTWACLHPDARFDVVVANVHRSALVRSAASLARRLERGGRVVASGFLSEQVERVREAWAREGFVVEDRREEGEWVALGLARADHQPDEAAREDADEVST
jgi:ribosomal protein L11 methyltransferase